MIRYGIVSATVCFALVSSAPADEPKKSDAKVVPITKAKLLGKWEGPKGVPITLEFTDEKVKVTVVVNEKGVSKPATLEWDYVIDAEDKRALLHPLDYQKGASLGDAQLKADGTLSVGIAPVRPTIPKWINNATFTPVKPKNEPVKKP